VAAVAALAGELGEVVVGVVDAAQVVVEEEAETIAHLSTLERSKIGCGKTRFTSPTVVIATGGVLVEAVELAEVAAATLQAAATAQAEHRTAPAVAMATAHDHVDQTQTAMQHLAAAAAGLY
jgi:hypothetical protein